MVRWLSRRIPDWRQARYLVMDLEMSGLSPQEDQIISAGWVMIEQGCIQLSQAGHSFFEPTAMLASDVGDSAHIHMITDQVLSAQGQSLREWMLRLSQDLNADAWVFHHAAIDLAFLRVFSERLNVPLPVVRIEDTLVLERQCYRELPLDSQSQLSLTACRARHGLPAYRQHHALSDALATAELFLVLKT